jgi:hypothetical protein
LGNKKARRRRRAHRALDKALVEYDGTRLWAEYREKNPGGVVCEKCGLEQPYLTDPHGRVLRCQRGPLLGLPCDSLICITHEHYLEGAS